jgi:type I restriction-modification system DNA methylase subunit
MSKYDTLDARTQLEHGIYEDLVGGLEKRGYTVIHNGSNEGFTPPGLPDIVAYNDQIVLTFEVTKSKGAAQDRESNSIKAHLNKIKEYNGHKQCFCVYSAISTPKRIIDATRDNNMQRTSEGKTDLKILPLCFETLELWITRLKESESDLYPINNFIDIFNHHNEFVDDLRIRKLLLQSIFPNDEGLAIAIECEETERDQQTLEKLIRDLSLIENYMHQGGIATTQDAINTLIYLVFLKLYEEKREYEEGRTNRLRSREAFETYCQDSVDEATRLSGHAIQKLFRDIKGERCFLTSKMFTEGDNLVDSVNDDFIVNYVFPNLFIKYDFYGTGIDALGAVYEILALRASKDVKIGQFFTPENVVRFMIKLADLHYQDITLDPACGTGRFLIYAMDDMIQKVNDSDVRDKKREVKQVCLHRLFGADIDTRIAKIAKMNMWIHGDGKSNIFGGPDYNGLKLHLHTFNGDGSFDGAFDVVLTNPPLGDLNYSSIDFVPDLKEKGEKTRKTLERMPILPHKNVTEENLAKIQKKLSDQNLQLASLQGQADTMRKMDFVQEFLSLQSKVVTPQETARLKELKQLGEIKSYIKLDRDIEKLREKINRSENEKSEYITLSRMGNIEWNITGNTMKGGAMFLSAIWHYLKGESNRDNLPEWRGGRMLIILDEGILNTEDYKSVREFLRTHFYIKAIISLTRDTFIPISKTSTKTSILYAIKKTDLSAVQKEPIFFGHIERVGLDTKGKVCSNDLETILEKYIYFKNKVMTSYSGNEFSKERFLAQGFEGGNL